MYRLAAAASSMPSDPRRLGRLSSSKWRSARTSRSIGSRRVQGLLDRSIRSARTAAWVGEVCLPRSWAARAAETAAGKAPR